MATLRAAVLGSPVAHSLSPVMHRAAYEYLGVDGDYGRHECDSDGLAPFVAGLGADWQGLSLTMPLKEVAFAVAARADDVATDVGAINTLVREGDGWAGYNTDVEGVRAALRRAAIDRAARVLVLGSGATTRSTLRALADLGCGAVTFAVRGEVRPDTAAYAGRLGMSVASVPLAAAADAVDGHDLVVDTLPGGAAADIAESLAGRHDLPALFEVVYEGWPTRLVEVFTASGASVASGLAMLAHQGAAQVALMTGRVDPGPAGAGERDAVADVMLAAASRALG